MKWAKFVRACRAAVRAFRESVAANRRIESAEARRTAKRKAESKKYRPPIDGTVETVILVILGILIGAILLR